ncbi:MAG: hypothetical protein WBV94_13540 [Blastocatellia bacterium]
MAGFEDLKRQAEQYLGKDLVNKIEREISKQKDAPRKLIDVKGVDFTPSAKSFDTHSTEITPQDPQMPKPATKAPTRIKNTPKREATVKSSQRKSPNDAQTQNATKKNRPGNKVDADKDSQASEHYKVDPSSEPSGIKPGTEKEDSTSGDKKAISPDTAAHHINGGSASERLIAEAIKGEYSYAKLGLTLGLSSIIGGMILGLNGVAGSTSWTASVFGLESKINDAAPGVVLFVVGIFYIWITRPKVKLNDLRG